MSSLNLKVIQLTLILSLLLSFGNAQSCEVIDGALSRTQFFTYYQE
jgi:hypothetical protein